MTTTYVAVDFETANSARASACQIGLVKFERGEVVDRFESLIKPHTSIGTFEPYNVQIHGITKSQVSNSPEFSELWPEIASFVGDSALVAHNAGFDMSVLRGLFDLYGVDYPSIEYFCTFMLARNLLRLPELNLKYVANDLGVPLTNHHDALADATAAGQIALALIQKFEVNDIHELGKLARIRPGKFSLEGWRGSATKATGAGGADESLAEMQVRLADDIISDGTAAGLEFVITGTVPGLTRNQAHELIVLNGGTWGKTVTKKTDFLVNGDGVGETNKTRRVYELREKGIDIAVIDPEGFYAIINP